MKKILYQSLCFIVLLLVLASCRKEEPLNVDLTKYNIDNPVANTDLDAWLKSTFLDEYNTEVVYRYNRYYHGTDKNIAAVNTEKVKPQMQTVLEGFVLPYSKIGGVPFIKKYIPKEFILYGSYAYQTSGAVTLATASAGRRITLYNVNDFSNSDYGSLTSKLRTIHHEFTHILNQIELMPANFQNITPGTYNATWTTVPDLTALANGYVSSYASSEPTEDFAETTAYLLVNGQAWFDDRANSSTTAGKAALKDKEASIVEYFNVNLGIDFRSLQKEVQNVVRNQYKNPIVSFPYWMRQSLFKTMTINLEDAVYSTNGIATEFATQYNAFKAAMLAYSSTQKYHLDNISLRFESLTNLTLRAQFTNAAGTTYNADYTFNYEVNAATGATTFTKVAQAGTTGNYADANKFAASFKNTIQAYLTGKTFIASWMPATINAENFNSYAGFSVSGTPTNYFYGVLGQNL